MNRERLLSLADAIEQRFLPLGFDMSSYCNDYVLTVKDVPTLPTACGTTACVAGWAVALFGDPGFKIAGGSEIWDVARELLGLSPSQADWLFLGVFAYPKELNRISDAEAVAACRQLAGVVGL